MEITVPVTLLNGRVEHMPLDHLYAHRGHYDLHFNRRGNLRHAAVKARATLAPLTHDGESFRQHLDNGIVWSLRGVRGSFTPSAAV